MTFPRGESLTSSSKTCFDQAAVGSIHLFDSSLALSYRAMHNVTGGKAVKPFKM